MEKRTKIILGATLVALVIGATAAAIYFTGPARTKVIKPLPDPFVFEDGSRVATPADWGRRREEIKDLLQRIEYGHLPGRPDALHATLEQVEDLGNGSRHETLTLSIVPSNATPARVVNFTLHLYVPAGPGPFPAIVKVSPDGTGTQEPVHEMMLARGYLFACYSHTDLDPDTSGYDEVGPAQAVYPTYDWGSLAVWAWGAMRVADYLLGEPWVTAPAGREFPATNASCLVVTGHSRRGKTALLAGAMDERFTMVDPNGSGCGGAGSFLVQGPGCETLASITSEFRFKAWFHEDFGRFGNREAELPFDQHFLRALVAPRVILSTDGLGDKWANPLGTQAVYEASQPVFDFLGASANNALHFREGGHGFLPADFEVLVAFMERAVLGNASATGDFYMTPFDFDAPIEYVAPGSA